MKLVAMIALLVQNAAATRNSAIAKLLAEATGCSNDASGHGQIVSKLDIILGMLIEDGLARYQQIPPKVVGVHPRNRYGYGVSAAQSHRLGAQIVGMGWSWAACSLAICIADGVRRQIASFTVKMQHGSEKFGKSNENEVKFGSLSCGHTNQFLVAAIDAAPTEEETLAVNGVISAEKITKGQPQLKEALDNGIKWLALDSEVEELYPELPNLIQRARQAVGQVQSEESVLQLCMNIQNLAAEMESNNDKANFDTIAIIVKQSCPKHPEDVAKLCSFVQLYGGGTRGQYLADLTQFASMCVPSNRTLSADMMQKIVNLKLESSELCPEFVIATLKCNLDCPENKVYEGICKFVKDTTINALAGSKKAVMIECNQHLKDFKKFARSLGLPDRSYVMYTGLADCTCARIVHELLLSAEYESCSVVQALAKIAAKMLEGKAGIAENPFADSLELGASPTAQSSSNDGLVQYDQHGIAHDVDRRMLLKQGFDIDANVESVENEGMDRLIEHQGRIYVE